MKFLADEIRVILIERTEQLLSRFDSISLVSSLVCPSADLWVEDEAVYVCEAHNHFGTTQAPAKVTVTGLGRNTLSLSLSLSLSRLI